MPPRVEKVSKEKGFLRPIVDLMSSIRVDFLKDQQISLPFLFFFQYKSVFIQKAHFMGNSKSPK